MAAPTFVQEVETVFNSSTTPKTTGSFSVTTGDVLVAWVCIEGSEANGTYTVANSGTAFTWTLQEEIDVSSYTSIFIWTATATATQSNTVTFTRTAGTAYRFGGSVISFSGSDGIGAAEKTNVSSGAPTLNITTTQADSVVVTVNGDWNATDGASRTWRTVNGITPTLANGLERTYYRDSATYAVYAAYYSNAGATGVKAVGLSAPGSQKYSIVAVEVKGSTSGGTLYTQTLTAGLTSTGLIVKGGNKGYVGGFTPVGAIRKLIEQVKGGSVTPIGSMRKVVGKVLSGVVTPIGTVIGTAVKVMTLAGSLVSIGALTKQVGVVKNALFAPVGAVQKSAMKVLNGVVTPVGVLIKASVRVMSFAGSIVPIGSLVKGVSIGKSGAIAPIGAVHRGVVKVLSAALGIGGGVVKEVQKIYGGLVTPVSTLSNIAVHVLTLAGSFSPVGSVIKVVGKSFAGGVALTSVVGKGWSKTLSAALAVSGGLVKQGREVLTAVMTPIGALSPGALRKITLSGLLSSVGSLVTTFINGEGVVDTAKSMYTWFRRRRR